MALRSLIWMFPGLNYQPVSEEIIRRTLRTNESEILQSEGAGVVRDIPENIIINELINFRKWIMTRGGIALQAWQTSIDKLGEAEAKKI